MSTLIRGAAFITGAGSGIGQYTAYSLAKHGCRQLAICDVRPAALKETAEQLQTRWPDIEVLNLTMDASKEDQVNSAVDETAKHFSRLDIAVNNAGIGGNERTHEMTLEQWRRVMRVNLDGVWLCQRAQIRQFLKQEPLEPAPRGTRGVIVNVASMLGLVAASPGTPAVAYSSSKHGVMGLTKTDAAMYAPKGIRINAMCPGYVATPLLISATSTGIMDAEVGKVPQGRLGEMEEIADCITFLASPMASFMTGPGLVADGGYTCL